jgi:predicted MFS family arabinose efflux permease
MSSSTVLTFLVAVAVLAGFAAREFRSKAPMLDLRFFRNPRFTAGATTITLIFFVMFGTFFIITQYLQSVLGDTPLEAGIRVLPWALVYMIATPRSAGLVVRFGQRRVVSSGLIIAAVGLLVLSRATVTTSYWYVALGLMITAAGMGMTTAPSTGAIMQSLPLEKAGVGSAVNDTTREVGGALGVAVFGSIVASKFHSVLAGKVAGLPAAASHTLGAALQTASKTPGARGAVVAHAARDAYVQGFDLTLVIAAAVALAASGLIAYLLRPNAHVAVQDTVALEAA